MELDLRQVSLTDAERLGGGVGGGRSRHGSSYRREREREREFRKLFMFSLLFPIREEEVS